MKSARPVVLLLGPSRDAVSGSAHNSFPAATVEALK